MNKIKEGIAQVLQPDPASSEPHDSLGAAAADAGSKTRFLSDPHRSREQTLPLCGARSAARMMQTERRTASHEKDDPFCGNKMAQVKEQAKPFVRPRPPAHTNCAPLTINTIGGIKIIFCIDFSEPFNGLTFWGEKKK